MTLELLALRWLRFAKACPVALFERSPRYGNGDPDVLGITRAGYMLEIEIKRSLSDFKANFRKRHIAARMRPEIDGWYADKWPKQFWFCVPPELVKKVQPLVPDWAGLLRGPGRQEIQQLVPVLPSRSNKDSTRLSAKEMVRLGHLMANQILSLAEQLGRRSPDYEPYPNLFEI